MNQVKKLIEQLVSNPASTESSEIANTLLTEYHRGAAVESLRILLQNPNDRVVGEGTWIASELGEAGRPLLTEIGLLLAHPSKKVRFWSLDCVLQWAGPSDGNELASAVSLVDDADGAVRWKAMSFLAFASRNQLEAALAGLTAGKPESPLVEELRWILGKGAAATQISVGLGSPSARHRRIAAAASVRIAQDDSTPLREAASSDEIEIAQFAKDMLGRFDLQGIPQL